MADDSFKVDIDDALAERVRQFAVAAGTPVEVVVRLAVLDYLDDWTESLARLTDYDRTGARIDAMSALSRFEAAVATRGARPL